MDCPLQQFVARFILCEDECDIFAAKIVLHAMAIMVTT